ncbi:hypothetical protein CRG98_038375 [Punica granatum]|uniref:Uncharacterized protein n=1 Tax=Punica granatum TaxID=22663 RepID=A0A2I0IBS9_PUNGR|nr:hypothetical protein CRG98_038375 [Punica granatum]
MGERIGMVRKVKLLKEPEVVAEETGGTEQHRWSLQWAYAGSHQSPEDLLQLLLSTVGSEVIAQVLERELQKTEWVEERGDGNT